MLLASESFESAQFLCAWADSEIGQLEEIIKTFLENDSTTVVVEVNAKNGHNELKIRLNPLPMKARGLASNSIKNLRDALDQAVHAATIRALGKARKNAHFPFGMDPADFETALKKGPCADIPEELHPILRAYEPYFTGNGWDGGDDILRLLGKISGSHKHRTSLHVRVESHDVAIHNFQIKAGKSGGVIFPNSSRNDEIVVICVSEGGSAKFDLSYTSNVTFSESHLTGIPATEFLRICHTKVTHIVQDLGEKAIGIGPKV